MSADGAGDFVVSETRKVGNVIAPDSVGTWRLRKSVSLMDARWYFDHGSRNAASICLAAARYAHREIRRIRAHLHARGRA
jgi:aminoglycoside phosphotransferase (APT) family kinase protein